MEHQNIKNTNFNNINFLIIEGNIGAGKTTLVKKIAAEFNAQSILEQFAENPFLPKFYKNPEKYSFPLELSFLAERYNQIKKELENRDLFKTFTIADYYFMKSLIFSKSTLQEDEYLLYRQLFDIIYGTLKKPDLYVYLHVHVEKLLYNIKSRGRAYEQNISKEYLLGIQEGYFNFFRQQKAMKVLIIDTNNLDFVNRSEDYELMLETIFSKDYQTGINRIVF